MAEVWVALLRGINVGKAKRVAMADLRAAIESLGYGDVRTLLNSGNAVFTAPRALPRTAAVMLQEALQARTGVSSKFTLRSAAQIEAVYGANPLAKVATNPSRYFAAFLREPSQIALLAPLAKQAWKPESLVLGEGVAYIWCPNGLTESPASEAVARALGDGVTVRNWATVEKLVKVCRVQSAES